MSIEAATSKRTCSIAHIKILAMFFAVERKYDG